MNRLSSPRRTSSSKARRVEVDSDVVNAVDELHAHRARIARRFGYDSRRISDYCMSRPLPAVLASKPSWRRAMRPEGKAE